MTKLTVVPPSTGEEDKNAEPKVGTAFKEIEKWANGEIDGTTNIKAEGVLEANLSKALQEKLTSKVGLTVEKKNASFEAETEKFYLEEKAASTVTLPASTANRFIGIYAVASCKFKTTAGEVIGDFFKSNQGELAENQKLVVVADGTNWRIFSGEPKRETVPENEEVSKATAEAGFVMSKTRPAIVTFYETTPGKIRPKSLSVGGVVFNSLELQPFTVLVNPNQTVKATTELAWTKCLL